MRSFLAALAVSLVAVLQVHASCGVERWSVKTGTDPQAPAIDLSTYISSTIYNFYQSTRPSSLPSNGRVAPRETNQYRLTGTLTKYVRETDSDYHLVIKDSSGRTMIIEIPSISCVGSGSPFGTGISRARSQFDAKFTATTTMKSTTTAVAIKGIGFWDFLHGQTGVAPNGIEIHPVLDITFPNGVTTPETQSDGPVPDNTSSPEPTVVWPADIILDDDGGRVHVYRGGGDTMTSILFHGGPVIDDPSVHVLLAGDAAAQNERPILTAARGLDRDERVLGLDRYGIRTFGFRVTSRNMAMPPGELTDLDVQRALLAEVESGRIQHVDPNVVYVVVLDASMQPSIGGSRDWLSYHSLFHPTELPMRYVVVRGGLDPETLRDAIRVSVARTLVNPDGDGWY